MVVSDFFFSLRFYASKNYYNELIVRLMCSTIPRPYIRAFSNAKSNIIILHARKGKPLEMKGNGEFEEKLLFMILKRKGII